MTTTSRSGREGPAVAAIRLVALGRLALGLALSVARPAWLEWLFGASARSSAPVALARMAGVRDAALGAATLAAAGGEPTLARRLALLSCSCDAADAAIGLVTPGLSPRARAVNVTAAGLAAVVGATAAWHLTPRAEQAAAALAAHPEPGPA
jgi:hypothetical protein